LGGEEGFPSGELGCFSGELELTAFGSPQAGALDGTMRKFVVDGTHAGKGGLQQI
jgi:hypothetical protein